MLVSTSSESVNVVCCADDEDSVSSMSRLLAGGIAIDDVGLNTLSGPEVCCCSAVRISSESVDPACGVDEIGGRTFWLSESPVEAGGIALEDVGLNTPSGPEVGCCRVVLISSESVNMVEPGPSEPLDWPVGPDGCAEETASEVDRGTAPDLDGGAEEVAEVRYNLEDEPAGGAVIELDGEADKVAGGIETLEDEPTGETALELDGAGEKVAGGSEILEDELTGGATLELDEGGDKVATDGPDEEARLFELLHLTGVLVVDSLETHTEDCAVNGFELGAVVDSTVDESPSELGDSVIDGAVELASGKAGLNIELGQGFADEFGFGMNDELTRATDVESVSGTTNVNVVLEEDFADELLSASSDLFRDRSLGVEAAVHPN